MDLKYPQGYIPPDIIDMGWDSISLEIILIMMARGKP